MLLIHYLFYCNTAVYLNCVANTLFVLANKCGVLDSVANTLSALLQNCSIFVERKQIDNYYLHICVMIVFLIIR